MPSRDSTGKRLSGAQQRARTAPQPPPLSPAARAAFAVAGDAPKDFDAQLVWARQLLVTAAQLVAQDELDAGRARTLRDLCFAVGATYQKATIEAQVKAIKAAIAERSRPSSFVEIVPGRLIKRPATARGQSRPRPRLLSDDATVDVTPEAAVDDDDGQEPDDGDGGAA